MVSMKNKSVAIFGANGNLGKYIVKALLEKKSMIEITVITRLDSLLVPSKALFFEELKKEGVIIKAVDMKKTEEIEGALKGITLVVSALGIPTLDEQLKIIEASKRAGVKQFIPSEFGFDPDNKFATESKMESKVFQPKLKVREALEKSGIEYVQVATGAFMDYIFTPYFGWDLKKGEATVLADEKVRLSMTSRKDIARVVAELVLKPKFEKKKVMIAGDTLSFAECIKLWESKLGKKLNVKNESMTELKKRFDEPSKDVPTRAMDEVKYLLANNAGVLEPVDNVKNISNDLKPLMKLPEFVDKIIRGEIANDTIKL